ISKICWRWLPKILSGSFRARTGRWPARTAGTRNWRPCFRIDVIHTLLPPVVIATFERICGRGITVGVMRPSTSCGVSDAIELVGIIPVVYHHRSQAQARVVAQHGREHMRADPLVGIEDRDRHTVERPPAAVSAVDPGFARQLGPKPWRDKVTAAVHRGVTTCCLK